MLLRNAFYSRGVSILIDTQLPDLIQRNVDDNNLKKRQALMLQCPSPVLGPYCNLRHKNTVRCQTTVVKGDKWREANMQLFLIESAQSGSRTALHSGLDQDHLWCWLKKGASSAGTQGERCTISLHISNIV